MAKKTFLLCCASCVALCFFISCQSTQVAVEIEGKYRILQYVTVNIAKSEHKEELAAYKDSLYIINAPLKQLVETPSNKDSIARLKKEISRQQSAFMDRHPAWMLGAMFGSPVAISGLPTEIEISKSTVKTFNAKGKVQRRFHYTYQKVNDNLYYLVTKKETL